MTPETPETAKSILNKGVKDTGFTRSSSSLDIDNQVVSDIETHLKQNGNTEFTQKDYCELFGLETVEILDKDTPKEVSVKLTKLTSKVNNSLKKNYPAATFKASIRSAKKKLALVKKES